MKLKTITFSLTMTTVAWAEIPQDVTLDGFIDTYYAYDFNTPKLHERAYTTQPVRHNEFNVNLAYFGATIKREKTRGRLALQYG